MNELIVEITLACLSFLFYKASKFIIGNLFTIYLALNKEKASQWRVLSEKTLNTPLSLPVLMTKGPRWNTHAIISTLGPFLVKSQLSINTEIANNSAQSWIAVVYSFPSYKTIATLESGNEQQSLELPPGKYTLGLRYYHWSEKVELPNVKVDGVEIVESKTVPRDINKFYHDLSKKNNLFYTALHYYIFTLLRYRKWFPESFVEREYLPVRAPDTQFFYGYLESGKSWQLKVDSLISKSCDIYLTIYNRASFPESWCQITEEKQPIQAINTKGFYLIRIRPNATVQEKLVLDFNRETKLNDENDLTVVIKTQ